MDKLLEKYLLRSIARAPEKEGGNDDGTGGDGGGGANGNGGAGGDGGGSGGGAGDPGDKGDKSALANAGLFKTRKADGGDKGEEGGDGQPGADGRPAHIPEKFWNAKDKTVKHDELAKAYTESEKRLGELKRSKGVGDDVPEKPEEYFGDEGLKLEGADRFGDAIPADDPGLRAWAEVCQKRGIGKNTAVEIAKDMFRAMNEHAPAPIDLEAEREALGKGADELIDGTFLWLEGMEREKKLGEDDVQVAIDLAATARGIRFLSKMRSLSGEMPIPVVPGAGGKAMSGEEWHSEYRKAVQANDYKRQAELDEIGERINGTEAASGTPYRGIPLQKDVDRSARK